MAGKENESNRLFEDEKVIEIEIERLRSFKDHPFKVTDDKEMHLLTDSIKQYGVLNPLIVRPVPDGVYEIISGHRRKYAAQLLGYRKVPVIIRAISESGVLTPLLIRPDQNDGYEMISGHRRMHAVQKAGLITIPASVREMTDDEAVIAMVDANLQRERISYSEKAFAYKMKNDAMKRTAGRPRSQIDHNLKGKRTVEIIAEETGESQKQVQRYITLTNLIPELLQQLDDELISFNPAVELAALKENEQKELIEAMDYAQSIPSLSQAQRMKKLSKEGNLSLEKMKDILSEVKKGEISRVTFTNEQLHRYFPNNYTPEMMKREIVAILKIWMEQYWDK